MTMVDWRRRTWRIAGAALLLALLIVTNPELRAVLWVVNALGLELVIFLIGIQTRLLMPTLVPTAKRGGAFICALSFTILRGGIRTLAIMAPPGRAMAAMAALSMFLFVLPKNLCRPWRKT